MNRSSLRPGALLALFVVMSLLVLAACGGDDATPASTSSTTAGATAASTSGATLYISAIPDQDVAVLNRQFGAMAEYLSEESGLNVEYQPMVDYAALVTAFERGDIHLSWFGGLTAVQAQALVDDAETFAQRTRDAEFHSKFIAQADLPVEDLEDLKGLTFTFGSESSTSGHLMPRYFLTEAGIDVESDFNGPPNYSGSHDTTIELVQSGAFQAGALNEAVWEARVDEGKVDLTKVKVFYTTPAYYDYNWTIRGDIDETFGEGSTEKIKQAILSMDAEQQEILDMFQTDKFIESKNENYDAIRNVARGLELIR